MIQITFGNLEETANFIHTYTQTYTDTHTCILNLKLLFCPDSIITEMSQMIGTWMLLPVVECRKRDQMTYLTSP